MASSSFALKYICLTSDHRERLDLVVAKAFEVSRSTASRWIKEERVSVETRKGSLHPSEITPKTKLEQGWEIEAIPPAPLPDKTLPESIPIDVLFEDEHLLALNKAPGMVVHAGAGHGAGTLTAALLHHCSGSLSGIGGVERPGIVHRLDKDTSGVMIVAKNDRSHISLSSQFQERSTGKRYLAYLSGNPRVSRGIWDGNIGRDPVRRQRMKVLPEGGRTAKSEYVILDPSPIASLAEIRIYTGRTHQIRVHAAHAGHPVVGDVLYARQKPWQKNAPVTRQLLHSWTLVIRHPVSLEPMKFEAPVPSDFIGFKNFLKKEG